MLYAGIKIDLYAMLDSSLWRKFLDMRDAVVKDMAMRDKIVWIFEVE